MDCGAHAAAGRVLPELLEAHRKVAKKIVNKFPGRSNRFDAVTQGAKVNKR